MPSRCFPELICPVNRDYMQEAVVMEPCGHVIDKEVGDRLTKCPLCRAQIQSLVKNQALQKAIDDFRRRHPDSSQLTSREIEEWKAATKNTLTGGHQQKRSAFLTAIAIGLLALATLLALYLFVKITFAALLPLAVAGIVVTVIVNNSLLQKRDGNIVV